jgi:hypothetical protein
MTTNVRLVLMLRKSRAKPPLPHMTSCRAAGQMYYLFALYHANSLGLLTAEQIYLCLVYSEILRTSLRKHKKSI